MSDGRDPAIKLFGKTIPLRLKKDVPQMNLLFGDKKFQEEKDAQENEAACDELKEQEIHKLSSAKSSTTEVNVKNLSTCKDKLLKKPDKILPCPRCNSSDTKFCYYNNYNVNQPRYFCKKCQRYWTAGGAMQNVPVGAGRRKSKNSASHYQRISVSDPTFRVVRVNIAESLHPLKPNDTIFSFGSKTHLCESTASAFNLEERTLKDQNRSGLLPVEKTVSSSSVTENYREKSSVPSGSNAQVVVEKNLLTSPSTQCINGSSLPYASYCASSFPFPTFYPVPTAAYWTYAVPQSTPLESSPPTLGKRSRDDNVLQNGNIRKESIQYEGDLNNRIWVPKTLRIDDPNEAAKSSIRTSFGIKNDKSNFAATGAGPFNAFQSKVNMKTHVSEASQRLCANPVAFARSLSFQESS